MRFAEAHQYYQEGHKIRRKEWRKGQYFDDSENYQIRVDCVLANDWEVVNNDTVDNAAQDYGKGYQEGYLDGLKNGYKQALEFIQRESESIKI